MFKEGAALWGIKVNYTAVFVVVWAEYLKEIQAMRFVINGEIWPKLEC